MVSIVRRLRLVSVKGVLIDVAITSELKKKQETSYENEHELYRKQKLKERNKLTNDSACGSGTER